MAAARNRALELARGEWIAFLDADDAWGPDRLTLGRLAAAQVSDAALVFSSFRLVDQDGACLVRDAITSYYRVFARHGLRWSEILRSGTPVGVRRRPMQLTSGENALAGAASTVRVVTRAAKHAPTRIDAATAQQRLADTNRSLAQVALVAGEHRCARDEIRTSMIHGGSDAGALGLRARPFLPGDLSLGIVHAWRAGRRYVRSLEAR